MTDELRARPRAVKQSGHDAAASPTLARIVEIIDELPKTVTGKVLRRELRDNA